MASTHWLRPFRAKHSTRRRYRLFLEALEARLQPALYDVGPGLALTSVNAVPWESLAAGDIVQIHGRPDAYHEKILISTSGTAAAPIRVIGVAGPNGERPTLDGENATTRAEASYPFAATQDRGLVTITRDNQHLYGFKPSHIEIEGLELRNANKLYNFTDGAGLTRTYTDNAAALFVERGEHIVIRNCTITGSGNGLFVASGDEEASFSRDILVDGNDIFGNGNVGSDRHHNVYTEASGMVFQYNHLGELRPGALGGGIKDRSAGTIVRGNVIEGGARLLDLVDPEGSAALMLQEPNYHDTYVYGNTFINGPEDASNLIHYGGDTSLTDNYRKGTLHFYNNTVVVRADQTQSYNTTLLQPETNDEGVELYNNILYSEAATPGATPTQFNLVRSFGTIRVGPNWVSPGWLVSSAFGGFQGTITGTDSIIPAAAAANDPGFVDLARNDLHLLPTSAAVDRSAPLDAVAAATGHSVDREYIAGPSSQVRLVLGPAADLGAFEQAAAPGPSLHVDARNTTGAADGSAAKPYTSVQAAVDAAPDDATIQVAEGTYIENVVIPSRSLNLIGGFPGGTTAGYMAGQPGDFTRPNPDRFVTRLQAASAAEPVIYLNNLTATSNRVEGFTVSGGIHGIYVLADYQQFANVGIAHNIVENNGPAMLQAGDGPYRAVGGGIYAGNATVTIADNLIRNNQANRGGGLFVASGSDYSITRNLIDGNTGWDDHGGGVYLNQLPANAVGTGTFSRNIIRNNVASKAFNYGWAGGVLIPGNLDPASLKPARLDHNIYTGNRAPSVGGALFADDGATVILDHELIYKNHTEAAGGSAIYVDGDNGGAGTGTSLTLLDCTIADNTSTAGQDVGNGIYIEQHSKATVKNSIFWGNKQDFFIVPDQTGSTIEVTYSDTEQSWPGTGNLSADPFFANAAASDYHEKSTGGRWDPAAQSGGGAFVVDAVTSPAIDAGDPGSAYALETSPNGGRLNLGVFGNTSQASRSAAGNATTQLRFGLTPAAGTAGQPLGGVRVNVTDAMGTLVASNASITVAANGPGGFSSGTLTVAAVDGVADFTDLVLTKAGTYTLTASSQGLALTTSVSFTVSPAGAAALVFEPVASSVTAGASLPDVVVEVRDAFDNLAPDNVDVVLSIAGPAAPAAGNTTAQASAGKATFSGLVLQTAGSYTFTAAATGLSQAAGVAVTVTAASQDPTPTTPSTPTTTTTTTTPATTSTDAPPITPPHLATVKSLSAPGSGRAGRVLPPLKLLALNSVLKPMGAGVVATVRLKAGRLLGVTTARSDRHGVLTFKGLRIAKPGRYTLVVTIRGLRNFERRITILPA